MSLSYSITAHAIDQCEARHGYRPTLEHGDEAVADILARRALLVWRHPHGHEEWLVRLACADVRVVYSPTERRIITVHPEGKRGLTHEIGQHSDWKPRRYRNGRVMGGQKAWRGNEP